MSELPERPDNSSAPPTAQKPDEQRTTANPDHKATHFDGNPNPEASESSPLGPRDDTPAFLEKKPFKK